MKVLLIDDHRMVNSALSSTLKETGRFSECIQANSLGEAEAFIKGCGEKLPGIIILDIMLGEENGLDFLPFIEDFCREKRVKKPSVLVCSALEETFRIQEAIKMNASGYINKTCSETEFLNAVDTVLRGEFYISGGNISSIVKSHELYDRLSGREIEIINLIKKNKSNKQIAEKLNISIRTVEKHISNIFFKTGINTRQELLTM